MSSNNVPARYQSFNLAKTIAKMNEVSEYVSDSEYYSYEVTSNTADPQRRLVRVTEMLDSLKQSRDFVTENARLATNDEVSEQLKLLLLRYSDSERSINSDKIGAILFADVLELEMSILELNLVCSYLKYTSKFRPRANDIFAALEEVRRKLDRLTISIQLMEWRHERLSKQKQDFDKYQLIRIQNDKTRECMEVLSHNGDVSSFDEKTIEESKAWQEVFAENK